MGLRWPAAGSGALSVSVPAQDLLKQVSITFIRFISVQSLSHVWLFADP